MNDNKIAQEERRRRKAKRNLRRARTYMSNPDAKLPRLLAAYSQLQAQGKTRWVLPEA